MKVPAGSSESSLVGEIGGFDDQSVAFPMASGIAHQQTDILRYMRPSIQRNDARIVDHLDEDHDVTGRLHDLIVVVVGAGKHRRAGRRPKKAAGVERQIPWSP